MPDLAIQVETAQSYTDINEEAVGLLPQFRRLADSIANQEDEIYAQLLSFFASHGIMDESITSNQRIFRPCSLRSWETLTLGVENTSRMLSLS